MKGNNQVILIIFIIMVLFLIKQNNIEPFKGKRRRRRRRSRENYKNDEKNNEKNNKKDKQTKEDFGNTAITNTLGSILNLTRTPEQIEKAKFREEMLKRREKRTKLIREKTSKNVADSVEKFNALKEGFFDIMKFGTM